MPENGIAKAVAPIMAAIPVGNPTPVTEENITALLRGMTATHGISPEQIAREEELIQRVIRSARPG